MTTPGNAIDEALAALDARITAQEQLQVLTEGDMAQILVRLMALESEEEPPPPDDEPPPDENGNGEEPPPEPTPTAGILISPEQLRALPQEGDAWLNILEWASKDIPTNVHDQNSSCDAVIFANAIVYTVTGDEAALLDVLEMLSDLVAQGFDGEHTLDISRNLAAFIVSADLINLPAVDPELDAQLRSWLKTALTVTLAGRAGLHTLLDSAMKDSTNHGTHSRTSVLAAALYMATPDPQDEEQAQYADIAMAVATRFHEWLAGENSAAFAKWGPDLSWQANPDVPVAINPVGAMRDDHPIGGVMPEEQRRASSFKWPPPVENYVREAQQGVIATALILYHIGYLSVFDWGQQAILRSFQWFYDDAGGRYVGDDTSLPYVVKHFYGADYVTEAGSDPGKNGLGLLYEWLYGGVE